MNSPLVRCSTCKRHIYAAESSCPFCTRQASSSPTLLAAALTAGLAMAGCGSEATQNRPVEMAPQPDSPPNQPKEIAEDPNPDPNSPVIAPAPAYGGPPQPVERPMPPPAAAYGAPPPMLGPMPVPVPQPPR